MNEQMETYLLTYLEHVSSHLWASAFLYNEEMESEISQVSFSSQWYVKFGNILTPRENPEILGKINVIKLRKVFYNLLCFAAHVL